MFNKLESFLETYSYITQGTVKLLDCLNDECLSRSVAPGHRTLGQIAWHIAVTIPEMTERVGLDIAGPDPESPPPASAGDIARAYREASEQLLSQIRSGWTDDTLAVVDEMYGEQWPRGLTLTALVNHEIHHRGQLTVLMRQAGLKVPGMFGPSQEEWEHYGMQAPPY